MASDFVDVLGYQRNQILDDVEGMNLELDQLGGVPSGHGRVVLNGLRVQVQEKSLQKVLLNGNFVGFNIEGVLTDLEDLCPEKLLQLKVLLGDREQGLRLVAVNLVEDGIRDHVLQDAVVFSIFLEEESVALRHRDHIVEQHADLIPQALVILFVSLSQNLVKWDFERGDDLGVAGKTLNGGLTNDFDQVPESLNRKGDDVGAEVFGLGDDANEVPADSELNDNLGDGLEQVDGSQSFEKGDHGVKGRASNSVG